MKQKLLFVLGIAAMSFMHTASAQVTDSSAQWTWVGGDNANDKNGVYGTINVAASTNKPGTRYEVAQWKDRQGNFWMFGGQGYSVSSSGDLNDLWKYNPITKMWTWMGGSTGQNTFGNYGTKGVAATSNWPGSRRTQSFWTDTAGNFWMFGGMGYATSGGEVYLNDLWKFDPVAGLWTWVSGGSVANAPGIYGTKTVTAAGNYPGSRGNGMCGTWVDSANNLWLWGGYGYASTATLGRLGDLWKYDIVADRWTWMSGSNTVNPLAVYGTNGVAAPANVPGAGAHLASWKDASGNFWMFGGLSFDGSTSATVIPMNNLWKYNVTSGMWTHMGGTTTSTASTALGVYGTRGVAATSNWPGGRYGPAFWQDAQGNLWLWGGYGFGTTTTQGNLNDLWKYDMTTNQWTWMRGNTVITTVGTYGTMNVQNVLNTPGSRAIPANWLDGSGNLWMFGGLGQAVSTTSRFLNDMWLLSPPPCFVTITASRSLTLCQGDSVILKANSVSTGLTYQWYEGANPIGTDTIYVAKTAGSYTVKITNSTCNSISLPAVVTVNSLPAVTISPATATICTGMDTALTASGAVSYTWAPATFTGSGATIRANPTTTTIYTVQGTGANGCIGVASRTVNVNSLPTVTITPATAIICNGKDTALTAGGGISYTWAPATFTGSGATIRANPSTATTYTVTATDANGCVNTATRVVSVNTLPNITITPATAIICAGKDTALTGNGGVAYSWLPASSLSAPSGTTVRANPTTTTTYTVSGMDLNGCVNTATRIVTVNTNPVISITPSTAAICTGKDTAFTAQGGTSFSWTPALGLNSTSSAAVTANPSVNTKYLVTGTDANGCTNKDSIQVRVKSLPVATITPAPTIAFCQFDSVLLTAAYTAGANSRYQWKNGSANVGVNDYTYMAKNTGSYTVIVTDSASCSTTSSATVVSMNTKPSMAIALSGPTAFCYGNAVILSIALDTGIQYQWLQNGTDIPYATTSFYQVITSGTYKVIASRSHVANCADTSQEVAVTVHPLPEPVIYTLGDLLYTDSIYATYQWYFMGAILNGATSWKYMAKKNGSYLVAVTDTNGCTNNSSTYTTMHTDIEDIVMLAEATNIYPNPAHDYIHIAAPLPVNVQLFNIAGQQLLYQSKATDIDISTLPVGLYVVKIMNGDGAIIKIEKLIKN